MSLGSTTASLADPSYQRSLGGGLIVRWSRPADTEGLAQLCAEVFRDEESDPPNIWFGNWVRDMMSGRHPLTGPGDFALVEDTATGEIVACAVLMRQTWEYDGIAISVGRPEAVATSEAYRNRGLIRAIFELLHARCDARGDLVVGITGIYYFYRQFGYEYALDLSGTRRVACSAIPPLKEGEAEPYTLREATLDDLPQVMAFYDRERARALVSTAIDEPTWRWIIAGQHPETDENWLTYLIHDANQRTVGCLLTSRARFGNIFTLRGMAVNEGVPLAAVLPSVLRAMAALAPMMPAPYPRTSPTTVISLGLGRDHPAYHALPHTWPSVQLQPYAWYLRVADLPQLLLHLAPALERRLVESAFAGYTGTLNLSFYRSGLRLSLAAGKIVGAEEWQPSHWQPGDAAFPPLVFLKLLFGHQSLDALRTAYPDAWANDTAWPLLEALFPAQLSWALPVD